MGREHRVSVLKVFDLISIIWKYIQAVIKKQSKNKQNPLSASKRYHRNMYFAKMNLQPLQIKISQCSECHQHISLKTNLLPITANMQDIYRTIYTNNARHLSNKTCTCLSCFVFTGTFFFYFIFAGSLSFASVKKEFQVGEKWMLLRDDDSKYLFWCSSVLKKEDKVKDK